MEIILNILRDNKNRNIQAKDLTIIMIYGGKSKLVDTPTEYTNIPVITETDIGFKKLDNISGSSDISSDTAIMQSI